MSQTPPDEFDDWHLGSLETAMLDTYLRELQLRLHEPERLRAIYGSHFFEQEVRVKLEGICRTSTQLLNTTGSSVTMIVEDQQITVASWANEKPRAGRTVDFDHSFCQHVVGTERPLSITDTLKHALVCESKAVTDDGLRSYLGVPLMTRGGYILGALCVWDYEVREWTPSDVTVLTDLAVVVMRFHESKAAA